MESFTFPIIQSVVSHRFMNFGLECSEWGRSEGEWSGVEWVEEAEPESKRRKFVRKIIFNKSYNMYVSNVNTN